MSKENFLSLYGSEKHLDDITKKPDMGDHFWDITKNPMFNQNHVNNLISSNPRLKTTIAGMPHLHPDILEKLSSDANTQVRNRVAENPSTPDHVLRKLSRDSESSVKKIVGERAPHHMISDLMTSNDQDIKQGILINHDASDEHLTSIIKDQSMSPQVMTYMRSMKKLAGEPKNAIMNHEIPGIRALFAMTHHATPEDIEHISKNDPHEVVRATAEGQLNTMRKRGY